MLCAVEAAVSHAESFPKHRDLYGPVLSELLDAGISATATEYVEAATLRAAKLPVYGILGLPAFAYGGRRKTVFFLQPSERPLG